MNNLNIIIMIEILLSFIDIFLYEDCLIGFGLQKKLGLHNRQEIVMEPWDV